MSNRNGHSSGTAAGPEAQMLDVTPVLSVQDIIVTYGSVTAVRGVTLRLCRGEVRALVGPNGAGKTSLLRAICGLVSTKSGMVELNGQELTRKRTEERARRGVTLVPEGRGVFASMTVEDNVLVAGGRGTDVRERAEVLFGAFPLLGPLRKRRAGLLSGGEQQILALARALMTQPTVLLLDEPSMGLSPVAVANVLEAFSTLGSNGPALLLVEQNARVALQLAQYVYVMQHGEIAVEGQAGEVATDEAIRRAYLGA